MIEKKEWEEELEKSTVYYVKKNGYVVGAAWYKKKSDTEVHMRGLTITPRFQREGIGREVLTILLKELKDVQRIDLVVHPDDVVVLKLCRSLGFVLESQKENYSSDSKLRLILVFQRK